MPTTRSNVLVSKSGCTSIRRPPGSTTASPQLGLCCFGDFLASSSTATNWPAEETGLCILFHCRFFRWRSSVLKLKPRLWQTRSVAYRCSQTRPLTAELRRGYVAWALTTLFLRSSATLQHRPRLSNRCVGQTLTNSFAYGHVGQCLFSTARVGEVYRFWHCSRSRERSIPSLAKFAFATMQLVDEASAASKKRRGCTH